MAATAAAQCDRQEQPADGCIQVRHGPAAGEHRKANVLLLTSALGIGGAETVVRDLAHTLDRDRFDVSVCCLRALGPTGRELATEGIDVSVLPNADPDRADYLSALRLRRLLRGRRIDVVHSHTTDALVDAALCRCLGGAAKVVHTFHFGNYPHTPARTRLLEGVSARFADRLVAVGDGQRARLRRTYRLADRLICAVPNGARPAAPAGDPGFRRRIGAEGKILVGTIAHLCPQKGLDDLLSVARRVRAVRRDVHFVLIGGGDLRAELEARRQELGLEDGMTITGVLEHAASRALPSFDIYFQPSLWEAMSVSILEAMAAGKSIVSTRVGEAPRLIEHGTDGLLYEPRDIEGMASAILTLAQDASLRSAMGKAVARKVAERFTVEHMTRAYERLYLNVLGWDRGIAADAVR
jgi:glycosyltransferase involved in cell wall biosynthesis